MSKIIQHLRADRAGWERHDIVPLDGEIALLRTEDGATLLKIGDGEHPFSALASLTGEVKSGSGDAHILCHGEDLRFGTLAALSISLPTVIREDYYATLSFDSQGDAPTALSYPAVPKIHFTGEDALDGIFVPDGGKHYTVFLWYDGRMQGLVRGVLLDSE